MEEHPTRKQYSDTKDLEESSGSIQGSMSWVKESVVSRKCGVQKLYGRVWMRYGGSSHK